MLKQYKTLTEKIVAVIGLTASFSVLILVIISFFDLPQLQLFYMPAMSVSMLSQAYLQRGTKWLMWMSIGVAALLVVCTLIIAFLK